MAQLVTMLGITHNPFMPKLFKQAQQPPGAAKVQERIAMMRAKLARHKPDVLITIGNDHLHQFFMDNMPAFMIGKMDRFHGTFYDEVREFGLPECDLAGDLDLCNRLLEGAFERGVDFAYSSELTVDHSIVVPMLFVRPESGYPHRPHPDQLHRAAASTARRFYEVGRAIRSVIDSIPDDKRVGVLVSGHLSLEVGGPRQFERRLTDPDFDARAVGWITTGDIDAAAQACTFEKMIPSGNMTLGFLNFLMAMGVASGASPTHAERLDVGFPAVPFFAWEREEEGASL